ncbi:hypothetical protein C2E31_19685 [Rhodopirellula baltica]|nr:hypothetical protein C2E31_19685 [Rhodopirellula baltica]
MMLIAIAFNYGPTWYRRSKFGDQYEAVRNNTWSRDSGTSNGYEFRAANGAMLSVWTTEHEYVERSGLIEPLNFDPDPSRYYVYPPGKWVNTVDEVMETWDQYD